MRIRILMLSLGLLSASAAANAQVKTMTIRAGGVLCLSCAHRLEKAIQRVEGVNKVKVEMEPVRAEVTPRGGAWVDPDRLRAAIQNAGFKPGDLRCTLRGRLAEWHGKPAIQLAGGDRVVVLHVSPDHANLLSQLPPANASGLAVAVEVEGMLAGRTADDSTAPVVMLAERVQVMKE